MKNKEKVEYILKQKKKQPNHQFEKDNTFL